MKKSFFFLILLLIFNKAFYSQIDPFEYFPIEFGFRWDYTYNSNSEAYMEIKKVDSNRVYIYYDYKPVPNFYSNFITSVYEVNDDTLHLIAKGAYLFENIKKTWKKPIIYFTNPLEIGKVVLSENEYFRSYEYEVVAIHTELEVLGKTYKDILEIKSKYYNENTTYSYFAKNIGLIREDQIINSARQTILELKEFSIN